MNLLEKIAQNKNIKKPVIYGLKSTELTDKEKDFFKESGPIGFILFARNIKNKTQVKQLTDSLRELMQGEILILIDQEGGRVARLNANNDEWPKYPSAQYFGKIYESGKKEQAKKECFENYQNIALNLSQIGINVNCAPLIDILQKETHDIIGDRAYGSDIDQIYDLANETCKALLQNNVYPVIKHIPGHGRATLDSHENLPIVNTDLEELEKTDFIPFVKLRDQKFAMTAHILYNKIDKEMPATISKKAIQIIRNKIGFNNILMSDDLSMKALPGSFADRTKKTIAAGCDLILHCNANMDEMLEIDNNLPLINNNLIQKLIK
jgi:beta-N-acetylhexosaminidase